MNITKEIFGKVDGRDVYLYTLSNNEGMTVKITNYGGIITSIEVPDKNGNIADVTLGFDSLQPYLDGCPYFGALVGRYANRIAKGRFELDGKTYELAVNNGPNALHGGIKGFDKVIWTPKEFIKDDECGLQLNYLSKDGEEGYPGNLEVMVIYSLKSGSRLSIEYFAKTDKATPVNLTYHGYFNLKGAGNGDILGHYLMIDADKYTAVDSTLIPTGELPDVEGTPFDFRQAKPIGQDIARVPGGYDHNFVLNNKGNFRKVAELSEPVSGRYMDVYTDQPGLQFYSGNFLDGSITGKGGKVYKKHYGLCLETQHFPDSPNHPEFPNTILHPGEEFYHTTVYMFGVKNDER